MYIHLQLFQYNQHFSNILLDEGVSATLACSICGLSIIHLGKSIIIIVSGYSKVAVSAIWNFRNTHIMVITRFSEVLKDLGEKVC